MPTEQPCTYPHTELSARTCISLTQIWTRYNCCEHCACPEYKNNHKSPCMDHACPTGHTTNGEW